MIGIESIPAVSFDSAPIQPACCYWGDNCRWLLMFYGDTNNKLAQFALWRQNYTEGGTLSDQLVVFEFFCGDLVMLVPRVRVCVKNESSF